jgi:hypothetical protein
MRDVVRFQAAQVQPLEQELLRAQGMRSGASLPPGVRRAWDSAFDLFRELAAPVGLVEELTREEFQTIYEGEGDNAPDTPLPEIVARSEGRALYSATVGEGVGTRIGELFAEQDLAVGYLLDAVASAAADRLSDRLAELFRARLVARGVAPDHAEVLPYSPGYCGWHISGQGRLFARLRPEEIGIHLNSSFLMTPLKSVSGVLVGGTADGHRFRPDFAFCEACATRECRRRMASVQR